MCTYISVTLFFFSVFLFSLKYVFLRVTMHLCTYPASPLKWKVFIILIFIFNIGPLYFENPHRLKAQESLEGNGWLSQKKDWWGERESLYYVRHPSGLLVKPISEECDSYGLCVYRHGSSAKESVWVDPFWLVDFFVNPERLD